MPGTGFDRRDFLKGATAGAALGLGMPTAFAQDRAGTLVIVQELGPNSLDMQGVGSNQTVNGLSWNCYDRLISYGLTTLPDGTPSYDRGKLTPELAESWEVASDGMSCSFKLRPNATFHDGSPVTAADVKWSFDRAVSVGGFRPSRCRRAAWRSPSSSSPWTTTHSASTTSARTRCCCPISRSWCRS